MKKETIQEISLKLEMLRKSLIDNGVSIGFDTETQALIFFDTHTYLGSGKYDGFKVDMKYLVK